MSFWHKTCHTRSPQTVDFAGFAGSFCVINLAQNGAGTCGLWYFGRLRCLPAEYGHIGLGASPNQNSRRLSVVSSWRRSPVVPLSCRYALMVY